MSPAPAGCGLRGEYGGLLKAVLTRRSELPSDINLKWRSKYAMDPCVTHPVHGDHMVLMSCAFRDDGPTNLAPTLTSRLPSRTFLSGATRSTRIWAQLIPNSTDRRLGYFNTVEQPIHSSVFNTRSD